MPACAGMTLATMEPEEFLKPVQLWQTALTNAYGNANRLTQISQGSANVSFGYDKDSLRTLAGGPDVKS